MKFLLVIIFSLLPHFLFAGDSSEQRQLWRGAKVVSIDEEQMVLEAYPVVVVGGINLRRYQRLVRSVMRVYPIAQTAKYKLREMEGRLMEANNDRERKEIVREVYKEIKEEYTPILTKMTVTDGRVLIRLIDRETEHTAYNVLKDFKGGLSASFWQGVGRIFGHNLKSEYGSSTEDATIEIIINTLYGE